MHFNSLKFLLVFSLIFGMHWTLPGRYYQWRKWFLILVSYLLYMNWKPVFALVLLWITSVAYYGGLVQSRVGKGKMDTFWIGHPLTIKELRHTRYLSYRK